ncbi:L-threonylcarbamoyladenylate synthase [Acidiphilium iwatense]|uniref:Threonylcarbamoyl-AMP synthase n=1 Tax=Acidiphilium iwatense TaxID=768198 RepID=A0ABS9DS23_9PROT|nr:L-threonylcarbamoyladenylate synthase [Acidiphilium iwatense]MCF3945512.1 threonylcarbamoyl-AMP synthase [Acidiphilium iwatense]
MTETLPDDAAGIARAAALLRAGSLVAFATETVYGLGADATNGEAVAAIFVAKGRPRFNPLICHYPDAEVAFADTVADERARSLAETFWPGPLTLVLPRRESSRISSLASAGLPSLAVRVPGHARARALLTAVGRPVAAPSANRSGRISPTRAVHVLAGLDGRIAAVLDSGPASVGLESTILDLTGEVAVLLRPGGTPVEALEAAIGPVKRREADAAITAPGMMASHYASRLPLRLDAAAPEPDEAWLGFGAAQPEASLMVNLSSSGDLTEAAANLFGALHQLDAEGTARGLTRIAVAPIPHHGLGLAINDRLARAAAPRA